MLLWTVAIAQRGGSGGGNSGKGGSREPVVGEWTDTTWSDNPFMAKLDVNIGGFSYICGGSIIATDERNGKGVILTAAHCLEGARDVNVWIGCTKTNCRDDLAKGYGTDHWLVHPEYDEDMATNDIRWCNNDVALIFLKKAITVQVFNALPILRANSCHTFCSLIVGSNEYLAASRHQTTEQRRHHHRLRILRIVRGLP